MPPSEKITLSLSSEHWQLVESCLLFTLSARDAPPEPDKTTLMDILMRLRNQRLLLELKRAPVTD